MVAMEDDSGLIDLNAMGAVDANGDPVSGLQRKAAIGSLDSVYQPRLGPPRRIQIQWAAVAVLLSGALLAVSAVLVALMLRGDGSEPTVAAVQPRPAAPERVPAVVDPSLAATEFASEPIARRTHPERVVEPEPAPPAAAAPAPDRTRKVHRRTKKKLPATPTRARILSSMRRVQPQVRACARGHGGVVRIDMVIDGPSGRVRSARASGVPAAVGRCMASAAKRVRFKPFAARGFEIRYPMRF